MPAPSVIPGRANERITRKSRALFHWRAADLCLTAVTGEALTFTRATPGGWIRDANGLYRNVAQYQPRFEYYDLDGDGFFEAPGLLIEGQRTNVVIHDRDLTITHQLTVTGGAGTFTDGETVTASGGGSGTYIAGESSSTLFALRGGAGTMTGTLTGGTSGATKTISSSAAVWTTSNMTAAKDQVGIDGVANAATRLTATAGNATITQAITLGSSARGHAAFVKRLAGSGTIQMSMDNGATWTTIAVTSAWTRLSIPTQTLANPAVRFLIITSGDAIAVDFVQNENGAFPSSPIATTTAAGTRNADVVSAAFAFAPRDLTMYARASRGLYHAAFVDTEVRGIAELSNTGNLDRIFYDHTGAPDNATAHISTGGGSSAQSATVPASTDPLEVTAQFKNHATVPAAAVAIGDAALSAFSTGAAAFTAYGDTVISLGSIIGGADRVLYGALFELKIAAALLATQSMREMF